MDLSITRQRERSKSHKSGIMLYSPKKDSLRKIQSFRLMDVEKEQIETVDGEKTVKIKSPKQKKKVEVPEKVEVKKKKIKLSKLRS